MVTVENGHNIWDILEVECEEMANKLNVWANKE